MTTLQGVAFGERTILTLIIPGLEAFGLKSTSWLKCAEKILR
jgi:hypothetical protein